MANGAKVISLGSINTDFQVRAERWPEMGHSIAASDFIGTGGGKGANVACAARRLGAPSMLIGRVGDDDLAEQALGGLRRLDVDLHATRAAAGAATGVAIVAVGPGGKKGMFFVANANEGWTSEETREAIAAVEQAPVGSVFVTDFEIPVALAARGVKAARRKGFPIVVDPSPADRIPGELYPWIDFMTPNASEARQLTGSCVGSTPEAVQAGEFLVDRGIQTVFIKMDDGGCVMISKEAIGRIPPAPVEVVDTTGAGDAFAGALAVAILEGLPPWEAGRFAVAASHFSVARYGSQPSCPNRAELESMLERLPPTERIADSSFTVRLVAKRCP